MLNGMERFWIEKIRVNAPMEFSGHGHDPGGAHRYVVIFLSSQVELLALLLNQAEPINAAGTQ